MIFLQKKIRDLLNFLLTFAMYIHKKIIITLKYLNMENLRLMYVVLSVVVGLYASVAVITAVYFEKKSNIDFLVTLGKFFNIR